MSLKVLPWKECALAACLLLLLGLAYESGWSRGHARGHAAAEAAGAAALKAEQADRASEKASLALALAEAEREAREKMLAVQANNDELQGRLLAEQMDRVAERAVFTRRIDDVAKISAATCAGLPPVWVRQYNAALGLGDANPLPGADGTLRAAGTPGADSSAVSGLPQGQPLTGPEDILAHIRDYGAMCRDTNSRLNAWIDWYHYTRGLR